MTDEEIKDWLKQNGFSLVAAGDLKIVKLCIKKGMTDAAKIAASSLGKGYSLLYTKAAIIVEREILNARDQL